MVRVGRQAEKVQCTQGYRLEFPGWVQAAAGSAHGRVAYSCALLIALSFAGRARLGRSCTAHDTAMV